MKAAKGICTMLLSVALLSSNSAFAAELVNSGTVVNHDNAQISNKGRFENTGILTNNGSFANGGELTGQGVAQWNIEITAEEGSEVSIALPAGDVGDSARWSISTDGTLYIRGTGAMYDFDATESPWSAYNSIIHVIQVTDGVTSIGKGSFEDCVNLDSAKVASSVKSIGYAAFANDTSITFLSAEEGKEITVTLLRGEVQPAEDSQLTIAGKTYTYSSGISPIQKTANADIYLTEDGKVFAYTLEDGDTVFASSGEPAIEPTAPSGSCGENAIWSLADGILTISGTGNMDEMALASGSTSEDTRPWAEYADKIGKVVLDEGITSIGDYAFSGFTALHEVSISSTVSKIGTGAFSDCSSLEGITIPTNVKEIGSRAFSGCGALRSISIPEKISVISEGLFKNCTSLKTVSLPNSITKIEKDVFSNASALETIVIPKSLSSIGDNAFGGCGSLQKVQFGGTFAEWTAITNENVETGLSQNTVIECASIAEGTLNEGISWKLSNDKTLTVSGLGAMPEFGTSSYTTTYSWTKYDKAPLYTTYFWNQYNAVPQTRYNWNKYDTTTTTEYKWNQFDAVDQATYYWNKYEATEKTVYEWVKYDAVEVTTYRWGIYEVTTDSNGNVLQAGYVSDIFSRNPNEHPRDGANNGKWYKWIDSRKEHQVGSIDLGIVTSDSADAYPNDGYLDGFWYMKTQRSPYKDYEKGSLIEKVDSTNRNAYPDNGRNSTFWYVYDSTETVPVAGEAVIKQVSSASENAYPKNGKANDGYWYISTGSQDITEKGNNMLGTVSSDNNTTYPQNGLNSDGFWYVAVEPTITYEKGETLIEPVSSQQTHSYPDNGAITNGTETFWYVLTGSEITYTKGTTAYETVTSDDPNAYQMNAVGDDGFWYGVRSKATSIAYSVSYDPWYSYRDDVENIVVEDGITGIGGLAFYGMTNLKTVSLPSSVNSIADTAFLSSPSLETVNVDEANASFATIDGVLYSADRTAVLLYPAGKDNESYAIADGVKQVNNNAFAMASMLGGVNIPASVEKIGFAAFYGCDGLSSVQFAGNDWDEIDIAGGNEDLEKAYSQSVNG